MKLTNIKKKVYKYKGVQKVKIEFDVVYDNKNDVYESKHLNDTLKHNEWILTHYAQWRRWDHYYTIDMFKDSLYNLGVGIKDGWCVSSKKNGIRALTAACMLDKAYLNEPVDKSYNNHFRRTKYRWGEVIKDKHFGKVHQWEPKYLYSNAMGLPPEEYERKMFKVIYERQKKTEEANKNALWQYIRKYIEHWWD